MTTAEQIYHEAGTLSESMRDEVLAYIQQLKQKITTSSSTSTAETNKSVADNDIDFSQLTEKQRKLYEIMNETAKRGTAFKGVDVLAWQKEQRTDKVLAFRSY